ncbi:hypothetical protein, partial [Staphylococcus aureus]|uniref:hypothetical protein n=1 Tax=Staphylococcus aureus TaxID=1280 RepID=UPI0020C0E7D0
MSAMPRHMRVVRWLDAQIEELNNSMALGADIDWIHYDMLIQTRTELQELKEDNALYRLNFG